MGARRRVFDARTQQFLRAGYDRFGAARFVADAAGGLEGPALDVGTGKGLLAMASAASPWRTCSTTWRTSRRS